MLTIGTRWIGTVGHRTDRAAKISTVPDRHFNRRNAGNFCTTRIRRGVATRALLARNRHVVLHTVTGITNRLLARIEMEAGIPLRGHLERAHGGEVLTHAGALSPSAYFPVDASVAMLALVDEGRTFAINIVGIEGAVGLPGVERHSPCTATVTCEGELYRVPMAVVSGALERSAAARAIAQRYSEFRLSESFEIAACVRFHPVRQRLSVLLLRLSDDGHDELRTTHEALALSLGVRRASVTVALKELEERELLTSRRGALVIRDRGGLERTACACYRLLRRQLEAFEGHLEPSTQ